MPPSLWLTLLLSASCWPDTVLPPKWVRVSRSRAPRSTRSREPNAPHRVGEAEEDTEWPEKWGRGADCRGVDGRENALERAEESSRIWFQEGAPNSEEKAVPILGLCLTSQGPQSVNKTTQMGVLGTKLALLL